MRTCWRRVEDVVKTCWRRLQRNNFASSKTSSRFKILLVFKIIVIISLTPTLSCIMLKNSQTTLKILRCLHRKIFKVVWPFFNIMHERANQKKGSLGHDNFSSSKTSSRPLRRRKVLRLGRNCYAEDVFKTSWKPKNVCWGLPFVNEIA